MAMQTGVSSTKILILAGAGLTGSIILNNGRLSAILAELQELMKGANQVEVSSNHYDPTILAAQIRRLSQEVRELTLSKPVAVYNGETTSSGLTSYILPAAAIGAMGYCYMWWKGWSFSDVMFVTKQNMASAVAGVSSQLEQVTSALAIAKKHLTQRLENLDGKVNEQIEASKHIKDEVNEVRTDLSQIGYDLESIHQMVSGLEGKIELIESKQDVTNAGIYYLSQFAGGVKDEISAKFFEKASPELEFNCPTTTFPAVEPLQGLQFLTDARKSEEMIIRRTGGVISKNNDDNLIKGTTLHRSYQTGITVRKGILP